MNPSFSQTSEYLYIACLSYSLAFLQQPLMKLKVDMLEAKHWIFPLNQPKRDYQFNIVKHCLFDNTLVALPTGLGKTFIAGVVMLNCESLIALLTYKL